MAHKLSSVLFKSADLSNSLHLCSHVLSADCTSWLLLGMWLCSAMPLQGSFPFNHFFHLCNAQFILVTCNAWKFYLKFFYLSEPVNKLYQASKGPTHCWFLWNQHCTEQHLQQDTVPHPCHGIPSLTENTSPAAAGEAAFRLLLGNLMLGCLYVFQRRIDIFEDFPTGFLPIKRV